MKKVNDFFAIIGGLSIMLNFIFLIYFIWFGFTQNSTRLFMTNLLLTALCIIIYKTTEDKD